MVIEARQRAGMSHLELSRLAKISPKTLFQIESDGIARFDAICRLAKALGQPVEQWLELAGHKVTKSRIDDVLSDRRPEEVPKAFPRLTVDEFFDRTEKRLEEYGYGLRCICVQSPVSINTPDLLKRIETVMAKGIDLALVTPFPVGDQTMLHEVSSLTKYYQGAHDWASRSARGIRSNPTTKGRVHVFTPALQNRGAVLVYPPIRVNEIRPSFTEYRDKQQSQNRLHEFGSYVHFLDGKPDQWIDVYNSDDTHNERAKEAFDAWHDYFREIFAAWHPESSGKIPYDLSLLRFWTIAHLDKQEELALEAMRKSSTG